MKKGQIWHEIEDGTPVRIYKITYSIDIRENIVYYESVERDWGNYLERTDFLKHYELCD